MELALQVLMVCLQNFCISDRSLVWADGVETYFWYGTGAARVPKLRARRRAAKEVIVICML